jgi:phosphatidylserine/phosphatidylglycerophosphate/cardiolipin synthase-like enzyme
LRHPESGEADPSSFGAPARTERDLPGRDAATDWFLTAAERGNPSTRLDRRRGSGSASEVPAAWTDGNDARVLIDGATYFERLTEVLATVRPGDWVYVVGLEGHADERLEGSGTELGLVLVDLVRRGACVRGLVWRSHPFAFNEVDNLLLTRAVNDAGGCVLLDHRVRRGGSHHQKIVIVRRHDDPAGDVAFVGGIDIAHGRGDGPEHEGDPQRADLDAGNYGERPPWHDVQVEVHGPAVDDIAYTFRERWEDPSPLDSRNPLRAAMRLFARQPPHRPGLAPDAVPPACGEHAMQVLRTYPARRRSYPFAPRGERSIAAEYRKVFGRARSFIYLEDQYLWSFDAAAALAEALRREQRLRLVIVVPRHPDPDGRLVAAASGYGRHAVLECLYDAGGDRVAVFDLENEQGVPIYVHSKVCIVDDVWIAIGSDNLNRRSWTHDSEISCAIVDHVRDTRAPEDPGGEGLGARRRPRDARLRLAAEHLGRPPDDDGADVLDPPAWFDAMRACATELDRWHRNGETGRRPPGHLREHVTEPSQNSRIVRWVHAHVLDPDGRPRRLRTGDRHGFSDA